MISRSIRSLITCTLLLTLALPAWSAPKSKETPEQAGEQEIPDMPESKSPFPKTGIRFVICSEGTASLPSPMYVKVGKEYQPVTVNRHMPSPRLPHVNGIVNFYKEMPVETKPGKEPEATPVMSVTVPESLRSASAKVLCIVQPTEKKEGSVRTYFMKESEFPLGRLHIINLTPKALEIITDTTGRFEGEEKRETIASSAVGQIISSKDPNVWTFIGKTDRQRVNYVLQVKPERGKEGIRIRSSVLMVGKDSSQISFVMMSAKRKNMYVLQSVQFTREVEPKAAEK